MLVAMLLLISVQAELPDYFDLRDVGGQSFVTSVKSQQGGTCWTHGVMASIESNLLMTGLWEALGETGEPDLAEYHLDWWNGFNDFYNADMDPPWGSGGLTVHQGGDYLVSTAYLSRGDGAVRDIDGQSYSVPPAYHSPDFHYYYPANVHWYTGGDDLESLNRIKTAIMEHGALATCYTVKSAFMQNYIQYQPPNTEDLPNHAVVIIGWDDNMITQAPEPGAWICKNSWGSNWGYDGFFYISYWDKWCGREPFMGAVSFINTEFMEYESFYYHDYHGWRDTYTEPGMVMNAFEATGNHYITAISFFTAADSVQYEASFYGSFSGGTLQNPIGTQSGSCEIRGFHTIQLDQPFEIAQGDSVFFAMEFSLGGYPYDRTAIVPILLGSSTRAIVESTAAPGESWYYQGGWHDFYGCPDNPYPETGNFCLKLAGFDAGLRVTPSGDIVFQGDIGGPFSPPAHVWEMKYMGDQPSDYQIDYQQADWLELTGPLSGTIHPGETLEIEAFITPEAASLPLGVYTSDIDFVNTTGPGGATAKVVLIVGEAGIIYRWNMDSDPGWEAEGGWEWGVPQGMGGAHGNPDPTSGFTGSNVYGYNLQGDYPPNMPEEHLTTSSIDCSGLYGTQLRFQRWLGVEGNQYDHAYIRISTDNETWFTIWENGPEEITDGAWNIRMLDISQFADGQPEVRIRWVMGTTDPGWEYCGWNIDDVEIWATGALSVEGNEPPAVLSLVFSGVNPASTSTSFACLVPMPGTLTLTVYDIAGREVRTLFSGEAPAGELGIPFNLTDSKGRRLPAGVYPVVARSRGQTAFSRLVVLAD